MNKLKYRHVNLKQRKLPFSKYLDFFKSHPTLVLLLPTLVGGMAQILQLANLGLPFIKYFSYAQVIPDGLTYLIVFVVFVMVLTYVWGFSKLMLGKISITSSKRKIIAHNIIIVFLINIVFAIYLSISSEYSISIIFFKLFLALSGIVLVFYLIFLFLYYFIHLFICIRKVDYSDYYSVEDYLLDKTDEIEEDVVKLTLVFSTIIILVVSSHLNKVNDVISNVNNVGNFKVFEEKIKQSSQYTVFPKVLYFNREYVFVEIRIRKYCSCDYVESCNTEDILNNKVKYISDIQVYEGKELLGSVKQKDTKEGS
jgi:hypothetical protein